MRAASIFTSVCLVASACGISEPIVSPGPGGTAAPAHVVMPAAPRGPEASDPDRATERPDVGTSNIKRDESVTFIPTFATRTGETWELPIEAWVYEPEDDSTTRAAALGLARTFAELRTDDASAAQLVRSMRPFLVDNERGKRILVAYGDQTAYACTTASNGRCRGVVRLARAAAATLAQERDGVPTVRFSSVLRRGDTRSFTGTVSLLEDEGISVVSDIDDTIKITACHDRTELLRNTLLREFTAAPGVAQLYRTWAAQGAAFHYVSNSPLPLLGAITQFIERDGFPRGAIELKPFRWKDGSLLDLLAAPEDHKQVVLTALIRRFETRRFVLVGDTGERDPEIYAKLARTFPNQIAKIYLRDPRGGTPGLEARLKTAFSGLSPQLWRVFTDGSQIQDAIPLH